MIDVAEVETIQDDILELYDSLDRISWSNWEQNFISDMYERIIIDRQNLLSEKQSEKILALKEKLCS